MNLDVLASSMRRLTKASVRAGRLGRIPIVAMVILVLAVVFPLLGSRFQVGLMMKFFIFAIFSLSLDVMWGYSGILSFGHAGFFGLGAYAMGLVLMHLTSPGATYLGAIAAIAVPTLVAVFMSYILFYGRVSGMYFGVITLIVSLVLQQMAISFIGLTGGLNGLYPIPPLDIYIPGLVDFGITGETSLYYFMLVCLAAIFLFCRKVMSTSFGRLIKAIEGNETRTEYFGYNLANSKIAIFSLSAALAGLAGGLYAGAMGFVSPDLLGLNMTTEVIVWVAVGGRGTLSGAILGALLVNIIALFLSGKMVTVWYLIMGLFLLGVVLSRPKGIMGYLA